MLLVSSLLLGLSLCVSFVQARYSLDLSRATVSAGTVDAQYVELPVDHFSNSTATFANRYWVNDEFYKDGGPVIRK
jgi:hypothetical protein